MRRGKWELLRLKVTEDSVSRIIHSGWSSSFFFDFIALKEAYEL
jgi:hypothetical protein